MRRRTARAWSAGARHLKVPPRGEARKGAVFSGDPVACRSPPHVLQKYFRSTGV